MWRHVERYRLDCVSILSHLFDCALGRISILKFKQTMPGEQKRREAAHEFGRERPVVVILVGAPGQGKSSVAAKIKAAAGAVDVVILCQDDVPRNIKRNRRQYLERQLRDGLASRRERLANGSPGLPVLFVVDRVHWNEEQRAHFLKSLLAC